jgi:hypothetical protein
MESKNNIRDSGTKSETSCSGVLNHANQISLKGENMIGKVEQGLGVLAEALAVVNDTGERWYEFDDLDLALSDDRKLISWLPLASHHHQPGMDPYPHIEVKFPLVLHLLLESANALDDLQPGQHRPLRSPMIRPRGFFS